MMMTSNDAIESMRYATMGRNFGKSLSNLCRFSDLQQVFRVVFEQV